MWTIKKEVGIMHAISRLKFYILIIAVIVINESPTRAQSAEREKVLDSFFLSAVERGRIAGVHALVAVEGEKVYAKTFGYADIESGLELKEDAIYRIASMTKIVTAMAALQLWEQGVYDLDDPVSKFLPEFKNAKVLKTTAVNRDTPPFDMEELEREPTIRDLFRHTAGIWGGQRYTNIGLRQWTGTLDGFVERLISVPLNCQPGTKFEYGYSSDVLGLLIEKWSGQCLDDYFREKIFEPLKLNDSGFVIEDGKLARLANHYHFDGERLVCKEKSADSPFRKRANALSGGGGWDYSYPGLLTSMDDWLVIMELIRNYGIIDKVRILKEETIRLMCSDQLGNIPGAFEIGTGYGLGLGVITDGKKHGHHAATGTVYWAGGPHSTYFYIDFENKISAAMFMQSGPFDIDGMMNEFLRRSHRFCGE